MKKLGELKIPVKGTFLRHPNQTRFRSELDLDLDLDPTHRTRSKSHFLSLNLDLEKLDLDPIIPISPCLFIMSFSVLKYV